jgi:uncharacterized pyridoxamine 5'-phosphate oxidase family protein
MKTFIEILKANPNGVLATQEGSAVRTRVFQYLFAEGNRVYFCTSNQKAVYKQLQANPQVSFCTFPHNFSPVLSVNGRAVFTNDAALKARALDENPMIKGIYGSPENPIFEMFYIEPEEITTFSFTEGERTVKF